MKLPRPPFRPTLAFLALLSSSLVSHAAIDDLALKMISHLEFQLRWDNVSAKQDYWQAGVAPERVADQTLHTITLSPGKETVVRVPAGEQLRIQGSDAPLASTALQFFRSNASGLDQRLKAEAVTPDSLLVDGSPDATTLFRIRNPETDANKPAVRFAVFVSRRQAPDSLVRYRVLISPDAPRTEVQTGSLTVPESYWQLRKDQAVNLPAIHERRLSVQLRTIFPATEAAREVPFELILQTSKRRLIQKLSTAAEQANPVWIDDQPVVASRQETLYFTLTDQEEALTLESSYPVIVRVLGAETDDYLLPTLNRPAPPDHDDPATHRKSASVRALAESEQALRSAWQNNQIRESGLAANTAFEQRSRAWQAYPDVRYARSQFRHQTTFYRDILPSRAALPGEFHLAYFTPPELRTLGEYPQPLSGSEQHRMALEKLIAHGLFVPIAGAPSATPPQTALRAQKTILGGDVLFDTDRDTLRPDASGALQELLERLTAAEGRIDVIGHTDSRASDAYNQDLSERRADRVTQYLIAAGIAAKRLHAAGRGEQEPRAKNDGDAGWQANRRVEIIFHTPASPKVTHYDGAYYEIPERFSPSELRVAIHAPEHRDREVVYLQFDDATPQELVIGPPAELPNGAFADTLSSLALRIGAAQTPGSGGTTASGIFTLNAPPAPQITAGVIEIPLPRNVRRVRLWRATPEGAPLYAAVQYRASKPFSLPESATLQEQQGETAQQLVATLLATSDSRNPAMANPTTTTLGYWQPLARLLAGARNAFAGTLPMATATPLTAPEDGGQKAEALAAAAADPLAALEALSTAATPPAERYWQQTALLLRLGEEHLALQRWRALAWQASQPEHRATARQRLDRHYQQQANGGSRVQLHAAALAQGDQAAAIPLAQALLDEGEADTALLTLLLVPPSERPDELTLAIAYANGWWRLFEQTLAHHPDPLRKSYWQGYQMLAAGSDPLPLFTEGDQEGMALADHLLQARVNLLTGQDTVAEAVAKRSAWTFTQPGPKTWRDASTLVTSTTGAIHLYQVDRDRHQNAFLAEPNAPLVLRFSGPRRLQIEARPLHPEGSDKPIDDWLRLRSADGLWLEPITDNIPADPLQVFTTPPSRVGRAVIRTLDFGPGAHELKIDGEATPLVLRIRQQEALRPLADLASPTADTFTLPPPPSLLPGTRKFGWCADCSRVLNDDQQRLVDWRGSIDGGWQGAQRLAKTPNVDIPPPSSPLLARHLANNDLTALLNLPPPEASALRESTIAMLWLAEQQTQHKEQALAKALAWTAAAPVDANVGPVLDRLSRKSAWVALSTVTSSAGRRQVPVSGAQVESPSLRIRNALLPALAAHERRLSGEGQLLLALDNPAPTRLALAFTNEEIGLPAGEPLQAQWQIDNLPAHPLSISPRQETQHQTIDIPTGRHTLRIGITTPVANQLLRVGITEHGRPLAASDRTYHVAAAGAPVVATLPGPAWLRIDTLQGSHTASREQFLAEPWQTLELPVAAGEQESLYRLFVRRIEPDRPITPPRRVSITPLPLPVPEDLPDETPVVTNRRFIDRIPLGRQEDGTETLSIAWTDRPQLDDQPQSQVLHDRFVELTASRRAFDPESGQYARTELLARLRNDGAPSLGARGELSGPIFNSSAELSISGGVYLQRPESASQPLPLPNHLAARESSLAGRGKSGLELGTEIEGSVFQRRPLSPRSWHIPRLTAFASWQSLDQNMRTSAGAANQFFDEYLAGTGYISRSNFLRRHVLYAEQSLDHDVFSAYRADHPFGIRLGDTYYHQPWRDTLWYGGATLTSNADLRLWQPDHLSVRTGWRQLLGPFRLQAEYQINHYLPDRYRDRAATLDSLRIQILAEKWRAAHQRSEVGADMRYDFANKSAAINVFWRVDFGNGRGFRDYRPGEVEFRDLRQRRLPPEDNNRIETDETR